MPTKVGNIGMPEGTYSVLTGEFEQRGIKSKEKPQGFIEETGTPRKRPEQSAMFQAARLSL